MYERPESYQGAKVTAQDDPRITPVGIWLREAKLNELPQLPTHRVLREGRRLERFSDRLLFTRQSAEDAFRTAQRCVQLAQELLVAVDIWRRSQGG
ncbi:MAG: hypothetical protein COW33_00065 [Anaerolineae bacterium CG17_big_fil_post_rev_8_21_14_2_50_57_27]|nr:MAG: hypothetical protein COW33_00065 [Anaerolineae bacterium CG17_big_fil_post_rev_8_21_14_2_50_57_27]PJH75685.1 MAG: hypothetical protein CO064_05355 [Anaerolineae bacterium CG_4_9_14_0_8_um_filter_58_9]